VGSMFGGRDEPLGINAMLGAVVVVVLCAVPSSVTGPEIDARLGVIAVGLTVLAAAIVDVLAVAVSVFVVNPEPPNSPMIFPINKY